MHYRWLWKTVQANFLSTSLLPSAGAWSVRGWIWKYGGNSVREELIFLHYSHRDQLMVLKCSGCCHRQLFRWGKHSLDRILKHTTPQEMGKKRRNTEAHQCHEQWNLFSGCIYNCMMIPHMLGLWLRISQATGDWHICHWMISFNSSQAIEARDRDRICTEYWRSRPHVVTEDRATAPPQAQGPLHALRGLFQRANRNELLALRSLLVSNISPDDFSRRQATQILDEEIAKQWRWQA